jgi:cell division septation protein DedD
VSELSHHDAPLNDEGFHEIQLSGKQLVALFMGTTVVAVVIFLCGVQVGRGVKIDRAAGADSGENVASASPPPASVLSRSVPAGGPPAAEPPAPQPEDELSYSKRLQSNSTTEKLKPQGADPTTPPSTVSAQPQAPAPRPAAQPDKSAAQPEKSAPQPQRPAPPAAAAVKPPAQAVARGGGWIVQLVALQDRSAAAAVARRLTSKGYPAFVLDPAAGAPSIYRVQVGPYADQPKAEQAARRLEKDEQFKPIVRSR